MIEGQKPESGPTSGGADAPTRSSTHQSPGTQLANRRMELNLSVDQVASRLNFAPRQILAIEADDYAALPGTAVTRGFIRAYAKLLQMDPAPLLQDIARHAPPADEPLPLRSAAAATAFSKHDLKLGSRRRTFPVLIVLLILALVIAVAFFLAQHFGGAPLFAKLPFLQDKAPPTSFAVDEPVASGQGQFMLEPLSVPDSSPLQDPETASPAASSLEISPAAAGAIDPVSATAPTRAAENNQLVLQMRQDSWLDIRRADNSLVFSGLGKAGETKTIDMQKAVNLKVGNVAGVNATLRGESFDLRAGQRGNVVRLTLE